MKDLLKYRLSNIICLTAVLFIQWSCKTETKQPLLHTNRGPALGTSYNILYFKKESLDLQKEIDSVFDVVNQSLSTYIPTSDISKINRGDNTLVIDHMFTEVFNHSKEIHRATNGYFDPTVGVLVNAWGFGPGKQIALDSTSVDSLLNYVGFDKVELTPKNTIVKTHPTIYFDFNAIAKGYAIDRLAVLLEEKGIADYLIEVGGEVVAKGSHQIKKSPFTIGIDDPQAGDARAIKLLIQLKDKAMASSGNYRKFRVDSLTGQKYVHTVNPKTGYTKNSNVLAANVVASHCAKADAYATAFMAMDLSDSQALLAKDSSLDAFIIYLDENGATKSYMTDGFKKLVVE